MKTRILFCCLGMCLFFCGHVFAENVLNSDAKFDIHIAVVINKDDDIVGKFEYANDLLQVVTFFRSGDRILSEPYIFEMLDRKIVRNNVHKIKCRSVNDRYGRGMIFTGTIDFSDESRPKIHLVNTIDGGTYISNITNKGEAIHKKYFPNVWLGY